MPESVQDRSSASRPSTVAEAPPTAPYPHTRADLHEFLDATPSCIVGVDWNFCFAFANRAAMDLLATPDLLGQSIWTLFPGNLEEPYCSSYRRAMEERVTTEFEAFYPEPLHCWFKVTARPVQTGILVIFDDVTMRKQAEILRLQATQQLQQVFDATSDGIVSLDREWRITFLNRRAQDILSVKADLLGKVLWEEFPAAADPGSPYRDAYRRTMEERVPTAFEAFYPAPLDLFFSVEVRPSDDGIVLFFRDITERRTAEQALRYQQNLLATVQRAALMATWDLDLLTGSFSFGAGSYPVFGHPLREVATLQALEGIVVPEHRARVRNALGAATNSSATLAVDFQIVDAAGVHLWIELRGRALGEIVPPVRLGGVAIDITARKRSENNLAASEERYRILADLNPQAIWRGDPDGSITYANQGFLDYLGLSVGDLQGGGWLQGFDVRDREAVVSSWIESVRTGAEYNIEARIVRARDGASRLWCLRGLPVRDEDGTILHWLGVAMDIHDERTLARELQRKQQETERQRAELENIYQSAASGLALFTPDDFRFLRTNDRLAEMVGLPPDQIVGRTLAEIAPTMPHLLEIFRSVAQGHAVRDIIIEGELPARPGEHRIWSASYTPVFAPDGTVISITGTSIEMTHQKKAEAALIQSEKLAAVGRLASSISHEINNPLEAITNLLYLIGLAEDLPQELKVYVHMAQSELSRVSQIATQSLRFHRQAIRPTLVSPADLVDPVLRLYQGRLANSGIAVDARYASADPILCFENDIRQVLNNLIANSIDAMRGGGRIIARAHAVRHPRTGVPGVRITIADTGHGMSAATRKRIFEPFYTTKDLNGTGLGLWISAGILERHQGTISVRSTEDPRFHGTIFTLFLPSEESFEPPAAAKSA